MEHYISQSWEPTHGLASSTPQYSRVGTFWARMETMSLLIQVFSTRFLGQSAASSRDTSTSMGSGHMFYLCLGAKTRSSTWSQLCVPTWENKPTIELIKFAYCRPANLIHWREKWGHQMMMMLFQAKCVIGLARSRNGEAIGGVESKVQLSWYTRMRSVMKALKLNSVSLRLQFTREPNVTWQWCPSISSLMTSSELSYSTLKDTVRYNQSCWTLFQ